MGILARPFANPAGKGAPLAFCRPVCYDKQNNDSFWEDGSDHENVIPLVRQRR